MRFQRILSLLNIQVIYSPPIQSITTSPLFRYSCSKRVSSIRQCILVANVMHCGKKRARPNASRFCVASATKIKELIQIKHTVQLKGALLPRTRCSKCTKRTTLLTVPLITKLFVRLTAKITSLTSIAHRWLSWLSTGLSRGRSWVQLQQDQHSGSLNNWGESAAFVITSANS